TARAGPGLPRAGARPVTQGAARQTERPRGAGEALRQRRARRDCGTARGAPHPRTRRGRDRRRTEGGRGAGLREGRGLARRCFGTDGVRGRVGEHPMTVNFALQLASAAARVLAPEGGTVLIGKDTRLSGYMFEAALEAGFVAAGVNVMLIGPLPTPGIAYMTRKFECNFGVVISASHNAYDDNGIKFFDGEGGKLSDDIEEKIEAQRDRGAVT